MHIRIDTCHAIEELMQSAVAHMLHCNVYFDVRHDNIDIAGQVGTWTDKQRVQEAIRPVVGKREIRNRIAVVPF